MPTSKHPLTAPSPEQILGTAERGTRANPSPDVDPATSTPVGAADDVKPWTQERRTQERRKAVDHPYHYGGADNPYEVIKVLEAWLTPDEFRGALKFNIHKYLARSKKKNGHEDIAKAQWYLNYWVEYERRLSGETA